MAVRSEIFIFLLIVQSMAIPAPIDFYSSISRQGRIVGGTAAAPGAHPHMAALTTGLVFKSYFCGASVITTRTVLTAAHCIDVVYNKGLSWSLRVTVGTNSWDQGGQSYRVSDNVTHPDWTPSSVKNDIGILHTPAAIVFNDLVKPIPVSYDYVGDDVSAIVAGWGRTSVFGPISEQLLELTVTTISGEQCSLAVKEASAEFHLPIPPYDPKIELCTIHSPGYGMCRGDSGSSLTSLDQNTLIGIVSWGFPCARGAPDVYVRINPFEAWIQKNTRF